ncbi:hypothetical protein F4808DRAFT_336752 [Astrocystis sublimbata]|nr:hypothetical protein F4808DRAFT_336752 [Astrocystis sublimbata]
MPGVIYVCVYKGQRLFFFLFFLSSLGEHVYAPLLIRPLLRTLCCSAAVCCRGFCALDAQLAYTIDNIYYLGRSYKVEWVSFFGMPRYVVGVGRYGWCSFATPRPLPDARACHVEITAGTVKCGSNWLALASWMPHHR